MKKKHILIVILSAVAIIFLTGLIYSIRLISSNRASQSQEAGKEAYYCAMHPDFISDKPGNCMICGMTLVKKEVEPVKAKTTKNGNKVLFYRNPMNPEVTSPVPMKDSMGMDYVPVYGEEAGIEETGVYISQEKQQLIGVKKEKVEKKRLIHTILTVGKVAYDPDLYVAQEEYLQAQKTVSATKNSALASVTEQSNSLLSASEKKLVLMGMNKKEIEELASRGLAQENLYLPVSSDSVWIYMTIYEYEIGLVKEGAPVEIDAVAFPGELFKGAITAIKPVLNSETRSIQARAEINNPEHKLKPEMFVNVKIKVDLGEKLAVSETAVLDTGTRKIVYLAKDGDILEAREVTLGQKAQDYFEVLDGLKEGDIVVTSGNFLVDSESRLKGAK